MKKLLNTHQLNSFQKPQLSLTPPHTDVIDEHQPMIIQDQGKTIRWTLHPRTKPGDWNKKTERHMHKQLNSTASNAL
jgi:hypothetical protein